MSVVETTGIDVSDIDQAVSELSTGQGYLLYERFFPPEIIQQARDLTYQLACDEPHRTSHFHGDETEITQKRVWNLPAKGDVFRQLCSDERILAIMEPLLGDDLMLSSFAANILYPGAPAQEGHVDYPYWDLHARSHWPQTLNASFFLAVEVVIALDDFTLENGATAVVPGSQTLAAWPDPERFAAESIRLTIPAGSVFIFPALLWHAGQANRSQRNRAALLGSYTCKSIKPIEDWSRSIDPKEAAGYSDRMQALLGLNYPYPAVMDALPARSSEGTRSQKPVST
jgi:ectoine hydroxylase-related dioxygenase (phytanoyl-CoA dioxygenase family)